MVPDDSFEVMLVTDFDKVDGNFVWCIFPTFFTENMCFRTCQACCEQDLGFKTCWFQKVGVQEMMSIRIRTDALKSQICRIKSTVDMQFYVISIL